MNVDDPLETVVLAVGPRDDDRLDRLARAVLQVAVPADATVVLTHVFTREGFREVAAELGYDSATVEDLPAILGRHESLEHLADLLEERDVAHGRRGVVEDVADGIVRIAGDVDADRVVISGGARSPVGKAVFGSTAQDVLLNAPCPVTYVAPEDAD